MPVTTRSATVAPATPSHNYSLRNNRPGAGHYAEEVDEEMMDAARTLVSMRHSPAAAAAAAVQPRRSARLATHGRM